MRVKIKRDDVATLEHRLKKRRLEVELQMLESTQDWFDNLVDSRDAYRVDDEVWDPVANYVTDEGPEPFDSEIELGRIRRQARRDAEKNPYAIDLLGNLVSFVVGKGHVYTVILRDGFKKSTDSRALVEKTQRFVDRLLKMNKWKKRQKENYLRVHRDGETILRLFPQKNGYTRFRYVEPADLSTPAQLADDDTVKFGIRTDEDDVEDVRSYFIVDRIDRNSYEEVDASEIQHRKANVSLASRRGLSSLYCIGTNLERGRKLLRNMSTVVEIQSAIAMIRKHDKTSSAVKNYADNNRDFTLTDPLTNKARNIKKFYHGTILDTRKDTDYEFPSIGLNPAGPVGVLQAELRAIASSKQLPEYMVGSDASNANYSSTMVAESPAVRFFESEQDEQIEYDLELIWAAIDYAIEAGRLPKEVKKFLRIDVQPPELVTRDPYNVAQTNEIYSRIRVKSPQTISAELGLDPKQEEQNWYDHDDSHLEDPTSNLEPTESSSFVDGILQSGKGKVGELVALMQAVSAGVIGEDAATILLRIYFGFDKTTAEAIVKDEKSANPSALAALGANGKGKPFGGR